MIVMIIGTGMSRRPPPIMITVMMSVIIGPMLPVYR
jgi:hypothetical protein